MRNRIDHEWVGGLITPKRQTTREPGMADRRLLLCLIVLLVASLPGCGGGGSSTPPPPEIAVSISPTAKQLQAGFSLQFTAEVTGTSNTAVVWQVNSVASGDASVGKITAGGLYTAPETVPNPSTVSVSAAAQADVSKFASASITITVPVAVSISPASTIVAASGQQQFSAVVSNNSNSAVDWEVNGVVGGNENLGAISNTGLYSAPNLATNVSISAISHADPSKFASASVAVLAPHRFGVRPTATDAEFFDRSSGSSFTPRGNNYIRLATLTDPNGNLIVGHSTFNVGLYDAAHAESALSSMQASGYNIVTVTLQGCCQNTIGDPAGGLSNAFIANVVDFLQRAKAHKVAVVFASSWLPAYGGFQEVLGPCYPQFDDINLTNLSSCGIKATKMFFQYFVRALIRNKAPLDTVFAYEIWDEYYYFANAAPLNATSGMITAANGQIYDLSSASSKQQMMDDGLVYFTDQVRAAILALDPTALVTISFFQPEGPNPTRIGDPRIIEVYPAIANSTADYVDLHLYPIIANLTMDQYVQNFGFVGYQQQKPILMGEYGAFISAYPLLSDAAAGLQNWQIQSCTYDFKGWLLWTWDTDEQPDIWNALSGGALINQALSPASRPDPCS